MINGGYILQPRKFDESEISNCPPHVREIWFYLLRKAFFKDGEKLKRGQLLTSYRQIINDLSWKVGYRTEKYKKHHCETAMKLLTKLQMIQTTKTTRGLIVTICNYDYYQNSKNYETDNGNHNKTTTKPQSNDTIDEEWKNGKNDNNGRAKKEDKSEYYMKYSQQLSKIISKKKSIKINKTKQKKWANEIHKLNKTDGVNEDRIQKALDFYAENIGGQYIPVIESGSSFREKFLKLEDKINRKQKNKEPIKAGKRAKGSYDED